MITPSLAFATPAEYLHNRSLIGYCCPMTDSTIISAPASRAYKESTFINKTNPEPYRTALSCILPQLILIPVIHATALIQRITSFRAEMGIVHALLHNGQRHMIHWMIEAFVMPLHMEDRLCWKIWFQVVLTGHELVCQVVQVVVICVHIVDHFRVCARRGQTGLEGGTDVSTGSHCASPGRPTSLKGGHRSSPSGSQGSPCGGQVGADRCPLSNSHSVDVQPSRSSLGLNSSQHGSVGQLNAVCDCGETLIQQKPGHDSCRTQTRHQIMRTSCILTT